jgi:hypothetical protein
MFMPGEDFISTSEYFLRPSVVKLSPWTMLPDLDACVLFEPFKCKPNGRMVESSGLRAFLRSFHETIGSFMILVHTLLRHILWG